MVMLVTCTQFTVRCGNKGSTTKYYLEKHCADKWLWLWDWSTSKYITCSQCKRNVFYHACKEFEFIDVAHKIFVTIQLAKCNKYILKINTAMSRLNTHYTIEKKHSFSLSLNCCKWGGMQFSPGKYGARADPRGGRGRGGVFPTKPK